MSTLSYIVQANGGATITRDGEAVGFIEDVPLAREMVERHRSDATRTAVRIWKAARRADVEARATEHGRYEGVLVGKGQAYADAFFMLTGSLSRAYASAEEVERELGLEPEAPEPHDEDDWWPADMLGSGEIGGDS